MTGRGLKLLFGLGQFLRGEKRFGLCHPWEKVNVLLDLSTKNEYWTQVSIWHDGKGWTHADSLCERRIQYWFQSQLAPGKLTSTPFLAPICNRCQNGMIGRGLKMFF